jgi:hypothetical protein
VVCEYCGSVVDMYGVLAKCGRNEVVCEYNRSVVDFYGITKRE